MAGLKRKEAPSTKAQLSNVHKKSKKEAAQVKISRVEPSTLEAETDSDPIIESDTTNHSGDDDGVSWPSDEGKDFSQRNETFVKLSATEDGSIKKATGTNDINCCQMNQTRLHGEM